MSNTSKDKTSHVSRMDERQAGQARAKFYDLTEENKVAQMTESMLSSGKKMCDIGSQLFVEYCAEPKKHQFLQHVRSDIGACAVCREAWETFLWDLFLKK